MIWQRVLTLFILCWLSTGASFAGSISLVSQDRWVSVKHVIDGDTFATRRGEKVRLLGINTPEVRHESSPAQPFGDQAKTALQQLISGQQLRLRFDKEKQDRYGRTLAHVYLRDGTWINEKMVSLGLAHVYTFVPNISAAKHLTEIETQAIEQKLGMWSHQRWQVLEAGQLKAGMLGEFRLVRGIVTHVAKKGWQFSVGKLTVSIPKKYRQGFKGWRRPSVQDEVLVRGRLRMSRKDKWFLSIHTPADISKLK